LKGLATGTLTHGLAAIKGTFRAVKGLGGKLSSAFASGKCLLGGGYRNRLSVARSPIPRTYESYSDPMPYVMDVVREMGINLRGSGQKVEIRFLDELRMGNLGRTRSREPNIIYIANLHHFPDSNELALTIAHELHHARGYLKGLRDNAVDEPSAYEAEDALKSWMNGDR
jgi:hypothetical protein